MFYSDFYKAQAYITQDYCDKHKGIDLCGYNTKEIYAPCDIFITDSGFTEDGAGNNIFFAFAYNKIIRIEHLDKIIIKNGYVKSGELIGIQGSTGNSEFPHLHISYFNPVLTNPNEVSYIWQK
jgi:murein DD-endopeptidase MepM/ murein hydrolase activator NlpD